MILMNPVPSILLSQQSHRALTQIETSCKDMILIVMLAVDSTLPLFLCLSVLPLFHYSLSRGYPAYESVTILRAKYQQ